MLTKNIFFKTFLKLNVVIYKDESYVHYSCQRRFDRVFFFRLAMYIRKGVTMCNLDIE